MEDLIILAELIKRPIIQTWNAIGSDLYSLDPDLTNESAMECVLDAGRMVMYGEPDGEAADELIREAVAEHGWSTVVKELASHISLA